MTIFIGAYLGRRRGFLTWANMLLLAAFASFPQAARRTQSGASPFRGGCWARGLPPGSLFRGDKPDSATEKPHSHRGTL